MTKINEAVNICFKPRYAFQMFPAGKRSSSAKRTGVPTERTRVVILININAPSRSQDLLCETIEESEAKDSSTELSNLTMPVLLIYDRSHWKSIAPFLYLIKRQKMKQILAFFIAIMLFLEATGQPQQQLTTQLTKAEYLKKSKRQQTTGIILVSSGAFSTTIGLVVAVVSAPGAILDAFGGNTGGGRSLEVGSIMFYSGIIIMAGSVPFFIASGKNKKLSRQTNITFNLSQLPAEASFVYKQNQVPSIGVSIRL